MGWSWGDSWSCNMPCLVAILNTNVIACVTEHWDSYKYNAGKLPIITNRSNNIIWLTIILFSSFPQNLSSNGSYAELITDTQTPKSPPSSTPGGTNLVRASHLWPGSLSTKKARQAANISVPSATESGVRWHGYTIQWSIWYSSKWPHLSGLYVSIKENTSCKEEQLN